MAVVMDNYGQISELHSKTCAKKPFSGLSSLINHSKMVVVLCFMAQKIPILIRGVHLTRQELSFSTRLVFFDKSCLFQQILLFSTTFSTNLVVFNKYCLFQHAVKKQVLSKKTRFVI